MLEGANIPYREVLAEEHPELTTRYGVRQAPTLVVQEKGQAVVLSGLSEIKGYADGRRAAG